MSGRVTALAIDPLAPPATMTLYAGSATGEWEGKISSDDDVCPWSIAVITHTVFELPSGRIWS